MKEILKFKNLLFLSIFILLSSCGKTIDRDDDKKYITNAPGPGGLTNVLNYKGLPFNGESVKYFDDEKTQLEERIDYKDGLKDGLSEEYNKNGQLKESVTYNEGEVEEEVKYTYYENGQLSLKVTYNKDEKNDGPVESYHENGQLNIKGTYKEGELDGPYESYHENGFSKFKINYKEGELDGPFESYHENGQLRSKGTSKDGFIDGQWEEYDENGKLKEKESGMYKDGVKQDD